MDEQQEFEDFFFNFYVLIPILNVKRRMLNGINIRVNKSIYFSHFLIFYLAIMLFEKTHNFKACNILFLLYCC